MRVCTRQEPLNVRVLCVSYLFGASRLPYPAGGAELGAQHRVDLGLLRGVLVEIVARDETLFDGADLRWWETDGKRTRITWSREIQMEQCVDGGEMEKCG